MAKAVGMIVWTFGGAAAAIYGTYMSGGLWPAIALGGALAALIGMWGALLDEIGEGRP